MRQIQDRLHAARAGTIEAELVAIACEQTGAEHGALFVWDKEANGLVLVHHIVNGITVTSAFSLRASTAKRSAIGSKNCCQFC